MRGAQPLQTLQCAFDARRRPVACTGAYSCARRFYLLFQHHTTMDLARSMNDLFGPPGTFSFCRQLGARVAVVGPDSRAERTVHRIISPEAYEQLFQRCACPAARPPVCLAWPSVPATCHEASWHAPCTMLNAHQPSHQVHANSAGGVMVFD
jgi:hypothetical protein